MAINFGKPATSDNYSSVFVPGIVANQIGLAQWLDSSNTTITGTPPTYAKRYNRASSAVEEFDGSSWAPIKFHGLNLNSGALGVGGLSGGARFEVQTGVGAFNAINARFSDLTMPMGVGIANTSGFPYLGVNTKQISGSNDQTYDVSGYATQLRMDGGGFRLNYAASGTAGDGITWATAMQTDTSGNVGIGASPTNKLDVFGGVFSLRDGVYSGAFGRGSSIVGGGSAATSDLGIVNSAGAILFGTGGSTLERMRIDASGNVGIGGAPAGSCRLDVYGGGLNQFRSSTTTSVIRAYSASGSTTTDFADDPTGGYVSVGGARSFLVYTNGAVHTHLDASGQLGVGLTPATSGNNRGLLQLLGSSNGGIYLGNTANAASNVLDWYEEGSFTPTATGGTTAGSTTHSIQTGRFVRIGRTVFIYIMVGWGTHTGAGYVRIGALPYSPVSNNYALRAVPYSPTGLSLDAWSGYCQIGQNYVELSGVNQNSGANAYRSIANGDTWVITGFYEV